MSILASSTGKDCQVSHLVSTGGPFKTQLAPSSPGVPTPPSVIRRSPRLRFLLFGSPRSLNRSMRAVGQRISERPVPGKHTQFAGRCDSGATARGTSG